DHPSRRHLRRRRPDDRRSAHRCQRPLRQGVHPRLHRRRSTLTSPLGDDAVMPDVADVLEQVPERIELDDELVVRTYTVDDMPEVVDAVNRNLEHLRPFMPWAQQPATVEAQTAWWRSTSEPDEE